MHVLVLGWATVSIWTASTHTSLFGRATASRWTGGASASFCTFCSAGNSDPPRPAYQILKGCFVSACSTQIIFKFFSAFLSLFCCYFSADFKNLVSLRFSIFNYLRISFFRLCCFFVKHSRLLCMFLFQLPAFLPWRSQQAAKANKKGRIHVSRPLVEQHQVWVATLRVNECVSNHHWILWEKAQLLYKQIGRLVWGPIRFLSAAQL